MDTKREWRYLAPRPKSRYRQLFIKDTRIRAEILYSLTVPAEDGEVYTAEEVAGWYGLPVDAVREAIEYCRSNPPEIAADHAREERIMEASGMNHPDYKNDPKKYYRLLSPQEIARIDQDDSLPG